MKTKNFWSQKKSVNKFNYKKRSDFFLSEIHLFEKLNDKFESVLDLGCASGNLIKLLNKYSKSLSYFGIDHVLEQIKIAKIKYPNQKFICANFNDYKFLEKFDLVNATGFIQHSSNYSQVLKKMIFLSNKYITFDVKIAKINKDIIYLKDAFVKRKDIKIPYIIFSLNSFHSKLLKFPNIKNIYYYGYSTNINENARIPNYVKKVFSVGYLLEKNFDGNNTKSKIVGKIDDFEN